jgi:hypothetical protein
LKRNKENPVLFTGFYGFKNKVMKNEKRKQRVIKILHGLTVESFFIIENENGDKTVVEKGVGVVELWTKQYFDKVISKIQIPDDYKEEIEERKFNFLPFEKINVNGKEAIFIDWTEKNEVTVIIDNETKVFNQKYITK